MMVIDLAKVSAPLQSDLTQHVDIATVEVETAKAVERTAKHYVLQGSPKNLGDGPAAFFDVTMIAGMITTIFDLIQSLCGDGIPPRPEETVKAMRSPTRAMKQAHLKACRQEAVAGVLNSDIGKAPPADRKEYRQWKREQRKLERELKEAQEDFAIRLYYANSDSLAESSDEEVLALVVERRGIQAARAELRS